MLAVESASSFAERVSRASRQGKARAGLEDDLRGGAEWMVLEPWLRVGVRDWGFEDMRREQAIGDVDGGKFDVDVWSCRRVAAKGLREALMSPHMCISRLKAAGDALKMKVYEFQRIL